MANQNQSYKKRSNAYKKGSLARKDRFSNKDINPVPIIILVCVVASFIAAIILGNYLGTLAQSSQGTPQAPSSPSSGDLPKVDKVPPEAELHAYFANMSDADPEISLSEQTTSARDRGNALFFELKYKNGELLYSSDATEALQYPARENLALSRLKNHLAYYADFAIGEFTSDFDPSLSAEERLSIKHKEITLLSEAADQCFEQLIVDFGADINKDNLTHYLSYLIDLKLACPEAPIGIKLEYGFITDADNSGTVAQLLSIADFYALDLGDYDAEALDNALAPLVYFSERYNGVIMLNDSDEESLTARITALADKKMDSYIIK